MNKKNIREFLKQSNTSQELTVNEVLEFTDSNIKWLVSEYEQGEEFDIIMTQAQLYSLIVEYKQLRDKLEEESIPTIS